MVLVRLLSRVPPFAPAHKPNKSIKRKVSDAKLRSAPAAANTEAKASTNTTTTAVTAKDTPLAGINGTGRVDPPASKQLDDVDAKGAGPVAPAKPSLPGHVAPNGVDATAGGQKLTGLVNAQPEQSAVPEPSPVNRAKHTDARADLSLVNGPSEARLPLRLPLSLGCSVFPVTP